MRIVIVEDESLIAERLKRFVMQSGMLIDEVSLARNIDEAAALLTRRVGAIVLLDLNLGGEDGFDILKTAIAEGWRTIVVSAHAERALEAFDLGVVDFVAKPFTAARLQTALERAFDRSANTRLRYLVTYLGTGTTLVPLEQIVAIHGADDYSEVETIDGRRLLHKKTLQQLHDELAQPFTRVHRSHIANLSYVSSLDRIGGGYRLTLTHGGPVPVGRQFIKALRELMV